MISISYLFLIPYGLFLLIYLCFSLVNLYHLIKFGTANLTAFLVTFLFLAGAVLILYTSYNYILTIDWTRTINIVPNLSSPTFE